MVERSTEPFWSMVLLLVGVLAINAALGGGTVSAFTVVEIYVCNAIAVAVSWWDLARHAPRVRLGIAVGLAMFPLLGFYLWWSWGIKGNLPGRGSTNRPA